MDDSFNARTGFDPDRTDAAHSEMSAVGAPPEVAGTPENPLRDGEDLEDDGDEIPDEPDPLAFDPVPLHARLDGWTPVRQAMFIQCLAESACVVEACRGVKMSKQSAYALRARPEAISFRTAWDAALDYATRRLADAVLSRAVNGVAVPVFYRGEQVGERRTYDERLAMFLLQRRDPLRYGDWRNRQVWAGHAESHAVGLLQARVAVREDAGLTGDGLVARFSQRLRAILAGVKDEG